MFEKIKKGALFAAFFFIATWKLMATDVLFKHIDASNGLTNNHINTIFKDSKGFVWFGTISGLNRWDGQYMKVFVSNSRSARALPDNDVESIQESRDGMLWIKTGTGYTIYDPRTEDFDNDMNATMAKMGMAGMQPQEIRVDRNHNMWINVKGEGVFYYKPSMKLLYEFTYIDQRQNLPEGEIVRMVECQEGMICCYSNGRMVCLDGEQQRIVWQEDYVPNHGGNANDSYDAFADRKDNIWLWNSTHLYIYKKASNVWVDSLEDLARDWKATLPQMEDDHIRSIVQDKNGRLWLATGNAGLLLINPNDKTMKQVTHSETNGRSLCSNSLMSLLADNNGVVWVGSAKHGVSYFSDNSFMFDAEWLGDITAIAEDGEGRLWLGTSGKGLICKNRKTGALRVYTRQNSGLASDIVSCLAISGKRVWVGSPRSGLLYVEEGKVGTLQTASDGSALATRSIQALYVDAYGNLWIGTQNAGLQSWNAETGLFTTYNVETGHLASNNVTSIKKSGNRLLVGTSAGLAVMQIESKRFKTYVGNEKGDASFRSNSVVCTYGDSRGFYWVGTREGLAVLDPKTDCLALIGMEQGLNDESVQAIVEDLQHNIWVASSAGLAKITVENVSQGLFPATFSITNYNQQDGLQNTSFNQGSILVATDGRIFFGGMLGLNSVMTGVQPSVLDEQVFFTRLFLNGLEVEIGRSYNGVEVLPASISTIDRLSLPHGPAVEIRVASDCFARSEKLQYVYKLDGVDNVWVTGGDKGIVYHYIPTGTHLLHLKSLGAQGEEKTLVITVAPRFWMTSRAIALYIIILLAIAIWIRWMRPRYKARTNKFKAMQDLVDNVQRVAEDFRAPVSTMIPPLNSLVEEEEDSKKREYLTTIHYQATQILNLTNKLQDFFAVEKVETPISDMRVKVKNVLAHASHSGQAKVVQETKPTVSYLLLLVDDNEEYLSFLKDSLPSIFEVITATTAKQAWHLVNTQHPQLVVCESDMEDMTGSELCVRMKSHRDYDKIPFILVTDSASASEIGDNGINNRVTTAADDYVAKPFNIQVLIAHMYKLLRIQTDEKLDNTWDTDESAIESRAIAATMDEQLRLNAEQFVLQNVSRPNLSVEEMAKSLNMSRAHLYKKLVGITGKTPVEFLRQVRLKQAAMLLRQGAYAVDDVAFNIGFSNVEVFIKYFKEEYGSTPEEYRKQYRI